MPDHYDTLRTAELEDEARDRGLLDEMREVCTTNAERRDLLRRDDAATSEGAATSPADEPVSEPASAPDVGSAASVAGEPAADLYRSPGPRNVAATPYPTDDDMARRLNVAGGGDAADAAGG